MSNRRKIPLQHELDHIHGFAADRCSCGAEATVRLVHVSASPGLIVDGPMRVAAASGLLPGPRSKPDKQETPEVGASEVSTDRTTFQESNGGCSPEFA